MIYESLLIVIISRLDMIQLILLSESKFALVTSGTATLEVSLFNIPQIVCYKTDWITYLPGYL